MAEVAKRLEQVSIADGVQGEVENQESRADALQWIEEERRALSASRKLLNELLSKTQEGAVARAATEKETRSATMTFGNQNSGFMIGVSNAPITGITFGGK